MEWVMELRRFLVSGCSERGFSMYGFFFPLLALLVRGV
jgi:hypothetical protein